MPREDDEDDGGENEYVEEQLPKQPKVKHARRKPSSDVQPQSRKKPSRSNELEPQSSQQSSNAQQQSSGHDVGGP